jgi:hypothetical protein
MWPWLWLDKYGGRLLSSYMPSISKSLAAISSDAFDSPVPCKECQAFARRMVRPSTDSIPSIFSKNSELSSNDLACCNLFTAVWFVNSIARICSFHFLHNHFSHTYIIFCIFGARGGVVSFLRHYFTNPKVAGSIPRCGHWIFQLT